MAATYIGTRHGGGGPGGGPRHPRHTPNFRRETRVILTGEYGRKSWPKASPVEKQVALPRAETRRQFSADRRLASKGGAEYLNKRLAVWRAA